MRYIDLPTVIELIPENIRQSLHAVDDSMLGLTDEQKAATAKNGNPQWTPTKAFLEDASNRKCWYTESKNPGCSNDIDHFRPKAKVVDKDGNLAHWYWFLAFNPINYRLSCQFSNRPNANNVLNATGGKGDHFPLMPGSHHATNLAGLEAELPVILDPCKKEDTDLIEFQPDGRPVISPRWSTDESAKFRVEQSNLLLNLDFGTFNEDREKLYNKIRKLVERGDKYIEDENDAVEDVKQDLRELVQPDAEYSKAAECYVRCFRDRPWVEEIVLSL